MRSLGHQSEINGRPRSAITIAERLRTVTNASCDRGSTFFWLTQLFTCIILPYIVGTYFIWAFSRCFRCISTYVRSSGCSFLFLEIVSGGLLSFSWSGASENIRCTLVVACIYGYWPKLWLGRRLRLRLLWRVAVQLLSQMQHSDGYYCYK